MRLGREMNDYDDKFPRVYGVASCMESWGRAWYVVSRAPNETWADALEDQLPRLVKALPEGTTYEGALNVAANFRAAR